MTNFRAALLTIRAWVERGSSSPLRATIRVSNDVSEGFQKATTVTTPEAAAEIVKDWLTDALVADELAESGDRAKARERVPAPTEPVARSELD